MKTRLIAVLTALVIAVLGAAAPAWAEEMPTYTLTFKADGTFEPARLEVTAGRFKIILINESTEAVEFESLPLRKEKVLGPGVKSFVVLKLSRPGEYPFFDDFHPDVKGTLVVKPEP
uniref:cupredoxin domain-containing protein n=1 Tax=Castellaniella defragrans TaxID=75697 RepID=UPI00333F2850